MSASDIPSFRPIFMSGEVHTEITRLLNLAQTYAAPDKDESLAMKNTGRVFTKVLALPTHIHNQNT
jgi:hypothetical protein